MMDKRALRTGALSMALLPDAVLVVAVPRGSLRKALSVGRGWTYYIHRSDPHQSLCKMLTYRNS